MQNDPYLNALNKANSELACISKEFNALQAKRDRLLVIVQTLKAHLDLDTSNAEQIASTAVTLAVPPQERTTTWMILRDILRENNRAMSLGEIHERANMGEWKPLSRDAVRTSLGRRTQTFANRHGYYSLIEGKNENGLKNEEATEVAS